MTAASPWSVKGIDPKAREIAKDLARRSGMTLGEWLNQVILEDGPLAEEEPSAGYYATAHGRAPAGRGRFEAPEHPSDEVYRVTEALDRLSARIEAAEHRSTLAISGIDQSVSGLVSRLTGAEREQTAVAARFEGAVDDLRIEQARVVERLRRIEQEAAGPRSVEALRAMEGALAKVATHLYEGEARTRETLQELRRDLNDVTERVEVGIPAANAQMVDTVVARVIERLEQAEERTTAAVRGLEGSLAHLDDRIVATEARLGGRGSDIGLEQLAASLSARVDAARAEMAEKIRVTADSRYDRLDQTLREMTGHVQAAERRSAAAIERMGHEVLRMADVLNRKVQDSEHRSAEAIEQVGGEMARIAKAMETRLDRVDGAGAQALEKLGGEIARITERLSERIADAERRSAQAIDDVGDQMTRFGERMQDRQDRSASELAERIRQSEERTARLLETARERIDQRLGTALEKPQAAPEPPPPPNYVDPGVAPFGQADVGGFDLPDPFAAAADLERPAFGEGGFGADPETYAAVAEVDARTFKALPDEEAMAFAADDTFVSGGPAFEPEPEPASDAHDIAATFAPRREEVPTSTRVLIDQARAAARAASQEANASGMSGTLFRGFGAPKKKAKSRSPLRMALLTSGTVAASSLAVAGYILLADHPGGRLPARVAEALNDASGSAKHPVKEVAPMLAMAMAPKPITPDQLAQTQTAQTPADVAPPVAAAPADGGPELYADGVQKIEARNPAGLDSVRKSANLGYAPAEFFLAKLYENGEAGVKKDPVQARLWTQRAADAGDRKAMHNLALYYFEGTGGQKNTTIAAQWFRRAAEAGLVDSQYNLGRLYEEGFGVAQNPAEAYKWYLIAAASGDGESLSSAKRLKGQLSAEAQTAAERAAQSFQAQSTGPQQAQAGRPNGDVVNAQRALSHLGYYRGPSDGSPSPALKFAIAAFQRDKSLPVTGNLDPSVMPMLAAAAR